jgi:type I restriction-modification system DNA methylase subunit
MDKIEAKDRIAELVSRYKSLSSKEKKELNEAQTKQSFIEPLLNALGWDTSDYKETSMEEIVPQIGRVDYALKINGVSRIYVEAKKLDVDLNNPDYIKQAVTYAYSKGINWALLTNFAEIHLFNVNESRDKSPIRFSFEDYERDFDRLWLLSKASISDDLLNKEAVKWGFIAQPIPIEERLFKLLRQWREKLFNQLLHHNEWLKEENIDEIIQKLFNRLIFIRTAEDRKIEDPQLRSAIHYWESNGRKKDELKASVNEIFGYYRTHYDSELFEHHLLDDSRLCIYEDTMAEIINRLYDIPGTRACYNFNMIDADVLGQVYEQYLGYVNKHIVEKAKQAQIRMSFGGTIDTDYKLVEKKQHRKEQGIYYTPKFVTDFIVKETVGRFLQEHSYNENLNIKILDPACGSGSFLIRAYDELLNYHADVRGKSTTQMDSFDRMPILTGNIFGVDLDQQAVEIARLNLLLRGLASQGILKPLKDNIKRGNSLISGTDEELRGYFGDNWRDKHPFNWEYEFKDIMANGGFDIIIGNPPYIRPHKLTNDDKKSLWDKYIVYRAKADIYACFIQKAIEVIKTNSYISYIVSNTFMSLESFAPLRKYILDTCCILYFGILPKKVFKEATVETIVIGLRKENNEERRKQNIISINEYSDEKFRIVGEIPQSTFYSNYLNIFDISWKKSTLHLTNKIEFSTDMLSDVVNFCYGLKTGDDDKFLSNIPATGNHERLLRRSDFGRYSIEYKGEYVWYVPDIMRAHRNTARPGDKERFERQKILIQDIGKHLVGTLDDNQFYIKDALLLNQKENGINLKYILALINSKLINYWYLNKFNTLSVAKNAILMLPIRQIDFDNPAEKAMHDKLVSLVEKMLELNKKLAPVREVFSNERDELVKEIEKTDREIDELVYKLYDLTPEEIAIVEGQNK